MSTHSFAPIIHAKLGYDPIRDFAPISLFAIAQNLLVVHPSVPVSNVKELVARAKARPGTLNYSSGGTGSTSNSLEEFDKFIREQLSLYRKVVCELGIKLD